MEKKKILTARRIVVTIFLIIFALGVFINFRGSYLEYKELGENYLQTFLTREKYFYCVMGVNLIFVYFIMYFTGRKIKKGLKVFFDQENKAMPKLPNKSIAIIFSLIESVVIGLYFTPNIMLCASNTGFGIADPIFNLDVSFYMFIEPLLKMSALYFIFAFIVIIIYSFLYYVIVFNKYFDGIDKDTLLKSPMMMSVYKNVRLIAVGIAIYILICSMDVVFDNFLTTDNNIKLAGSGFIDSTIKYWGYNILALIILISIFRATKSAKKGMQTKILKQLLVIPIYLVFLFIVMLLFDLIFVRTNKFDREKTYIESNMVATKQAYAIDCETESIQYSGTITVDKAKRNEEIINNTVIVDKEIVLEYLNETQTGKGYYTYNTINLSNYIVDGKNELVYVSPREIVNSRRTYNSKTYEYTHGYGLIFTSATNVNENGEVKYFQNDITGNDNKIKIATPQIYYGMETNTTVVTNAKNKKEFDYADDDKVYENDYEGTAGISLNFIDRIVLGIKERNINLGLSSSVTSNSKVLINRNIIKRAKLALPDVVYDEEPYTVVNEDGEIYWVLDAYTISSSYPYSTYTEIEYNGQKRGINYIRNSIKVIINAYNGEMKYYITDRTDPIAMAYRKIYPSLFQDLEEEILASIQDQFIYPKFLYNVQSTMLEEYHNTKAEVLYRSDDTWEKATYKNNQTNSKTASVLDSYYTTVKNNKGNETIGLIQMYTQKDKQNLTGYLIGTVQNGQNRLSLKTLHSDSGILGPTQLDNQIMQNEKIKDEIDKLNVTGAKLTKKMIILPVEDTLIYIEPIYQTLINENNLPVLKKVVVASGNKVAIEDNLSEAVINLISQYATSIDTESTEDIEGLVEAIIKANNNLTNSFSSNNWGLVGNDIERLQTLINTLEKERKKEKKENEENDIKTNYDTETTNNNEIDSEETLEIENLIE